MVGSRSVALGGPVRRGNPAAAAGLALIAPAVATLVGLVIRRILAVAFIQVRRMRKGGSVNFDHLDGAGRADDVGL